MKSLLIIPILLASVASLAFGQYTCSPIERSGFTGGSISLPTDPSIGAITIGNAEAYWTGACGQGGSIPNFFINNPYTDLQIPVTYHESYSADGCGSTTWYQLPGAQPRPVSIDLYKYGPNEFNVTIMCNPTDTLAHEIGHVLGLGHATSDACRGDIMGRAVGDQPRSVMGDDCVAADTAWYTTMEYLRDNPPPPNGGSGGSDGGPDPNERNADGCGDDCSPIIINFEHGAYRLTGSSAPVRFAMKPGSAPTLMGWTEAGADESFLWLDRDENGSVTNGGELFGNFTPLLGGGYAKNGFVALKDFDRNGDGVIDERDAIWSQLLLWRDLNHNGISEASEIVRLADSNVLAIDLHYHFAGRHDTWGNTFRYESLVSIKDPSGHADRKEPVYDVFFVPAAP